MLIGPTTAIVSVGMSCQTAHQIYEHQELLETLARETMIRMATPFDWTICAPADVAGMITEREFFPEKFDECVGEGKVYWPRRRCWFWHAKALSGPRLAAKIAHAVGNWDKIAGARRKIFIVSNTQNNLVKTRKEAIRRLEPDLEPELGMRGDFLIDFTSSGLEALSSALRGQFGDASLDIVCPSEKRAGIAGASKVNEKINMTILQRDHSQWFGDPERWAELFHSIFRRVSSSAPDCGPSQQMAGSA